MSASLRRIRFGASTFVVAATLVAAAIHETSLGEAAMATADADGLRGDWRSAIQHAREAAETVAPGSPWPDQALRRLEALGHNAEIRGDDATALLAYDAMRAAALSTRWWGFSDRSTWSDRADASIARLAGGEPGR